MQSLNLNTLTYLYSNGKYSILQSKSKRFKKQLIPTHKYTNEDSPL